MNKTKKNITIENGKTREVTYEYKWSESFAYSLATPCIMDYSFDEAGLSVEELNEFHILIEQSYNSVEESILYHAESF